MTTQLAPTPIVTGEQAKMILEKIQQQPSVKSQEGAAKLKIMFESKHK
jgi:hypothetical protein